jgi:hypothetical protein
MLRDVREREVNKIVKFSVHDKKAKNKAAGGDAGLPPAALFFGSLRAA